MGIFVGARVDNKEKRVSNGEVGNVTIELRFDVLTCVFAKLVLIQVM